MGISSAVIGKLLDECESGIATEGCIPVRRDDLKAILQELNSLRRQISGKRITDPKEEELIKRLEARIRFIESTIEAHGAAIAQLQTGSGRVVASMFGGS